MIRHFVISEPAVTAVFDDGLSITAPKWRHKSDRPSWRDLCRRIDCEPFKSVRAYARQHGIEVYG